MGCRAFEWVLDIINTPLIFAFIQMLIEVLKVKSYFEVRRKLKISKPLFGRKSFVFYKGF